MISGCTRGAHALKVPKPRRVVTMFWSRVNDADPAHTWLRSTLADVARNCDP
jgi:hypothetical protein